MASALGPIAMGRSETAALPGISLPLRALWKTLSLSKTLNLSKESPSQSETGPLPQSENNWLASAPGYSQSATFTIAESAADTTAIRGPMLDEMAQWIQSGGFSWSAPLDEEELEEMSWELTASIVAAMGTMLERDWQSYRERLAVWKMRAAMARQYATPLTDEQQQERDAWFALQDDALAFVFAHGADD